MLGVLFQNCNDFLLAISFTDCVLNLSSFYQLKISGTKFSNCKMHHVDFTEATAKNTSFLNCDLDQSIFYKTNLENSNFQSAFNVVFDPSNNQIKNAIFSKDNCFGLLKAFKIKIK